MSNVTLDPLKGLPVASSTEVIDKAIEVMAPCLGVDDDSPEVEQLRQILGGPGLNTMAQLYIPKQAAVPKSAAAFVIPDRGRAWD